jgi:UDP-glucose 4-epimerase
MKILVTGNAGFMGSHLAEALVKQGHEVWGMDDLSGGFKRNVHNDGQQFYKDISDKDVYDMVSSLKPDVLYHLAADATEGRSQFTPISATRRNLMGYMNVLTGAIDGGVKKVILTSSMSVYGDQTPPFSEDMERKPADVYAVNKTAMERATEILSSVHEFDYTIIRPHNVFGERQNIRDPYRNVVGIFMNRIMRGLPPIIYGDGKQTRAFTHIDNFTPYIIQCMTNENTNGEIINIGPIEEYTINHLAETVLESFGSDLKPIHYPDRPLEVKHAYCTADKAERLLGYKTTTSFETGIKRMAEWAKELGPQELIYQDLEIVNDKTPKTWSEREM